MLPNSFDQPLMSLSFLVASICMALIYKVLTLLQHFIPLLSILIDAIFSFIYVCAFIVITHLFFNGRIKFFAITVYIIGFCVSNISLNAFLKKRH
jgi:hypothetical protein